MPGQISAKYASPALRWGLCLEDHPGAWVIFDISKGRDIFELSNVDVITGHDLRLDDDYVTAIIYFSAEPAEGDDRSNYRLPILGWKPLDSEIKGALDHPSDRFNLLCTKAHGRALKRAGYPDDLDDLRALIVWRQRSAEIEAIKSGTAGLQMKPSDPEAALAAAARFDPEATGPDDGNSPDHDSERPPAPAENDQAPTDSTKAELRQTINTLGSRGPELTRWAKAQGYKITKPASEAEALAMVAEGRRMLGEPAETPPVTAGRALTPAEVDAAAPDAAEAAQGGTTAPPGDQDPPTGGQDEDAHIEKATTIAELIAGLDAEGTKAFVAYCKSIGVDAKATTWSEAPPDVLTEVLTWLEIG